MIKTSLIGCGNVGSRHLQAILKLPYDIDLSIVEPSKEAQNLAKKRMKEIEYDKNKYNISWYDSINKLKEPSNITVVATTAVGRVNLLINLLEEGHSRFLIEKVVCQSSEEFKILLNKMKEFKAKGWVNTNLRYFEAYQNFKKYFQDSKIIHLSVIASNISALGTNAIHYVDLFSYLTNCSSLLFITLLRKI